jgi:hypothetical protein
MPRRRRTEDGKLMFGRSYGLVLETLELVHSLSGLAPGDMMLPIDPGMSTAAEVEEPPIVLPGDGVPPVVPPANPTGPVGPA